MSDHETHPPKDPEPLRCPSCGGEFQADDVVCPHCGETLAAG